MTVTLMARPLWRRWKGRVLLTCLRCGQDAALDHAIAPDGTVSPSVGCPAGCGWHVHVRLVDWNEEGA